MQQILELWVDLKEIILEFRDEVSSGIIFAKSDVSIGL